MQLGISETTLLNSYFFPQCWHLSIPVCSCQALTTNTGQAPFGLNDDTHYRHAKTKR